MPKMNPPPHAATPPCLSPQAVRGRGAGPPVDRSRLAASAAAAPLDPPESSSHTRMNTGDDEFFWQNEAQRTIESMPWEHRGWHQTRKRVFASMCRTGISTARRSRFWTCGDRVHVMRHTSTEELDVYSEKCHDRFCMRCGQLRSRRIAECMEALMKPATDRLMFLTLTVLGRPTDSLASMIDRLRNAWKELRRLKGWQNHIRGGAVMLEIKWSATSGGHWHPHYHIVCEGTWIEEAWLRAAWKLITRDSHECNVQRIKEPEKALGYVVKYASKPMDSSFTSRSFLLDEAMTALKGVRLASCFGTWHGTPLSTKLEKEAIDETEAITSWVYEGTTSDLEFRATRGDQAATQLLQHVERLLRIRSLRYARPTGPPTNATPPRLVSLHPGDAGGLAESTT